MNAKLIKFKRYCELLNKTYGSKEKSTSEELAELGKLSYELKLCGVPDIIAEMNFDSLQRELEELEG
ncbi:hypothetical protein [Bacillus cereus]|uniref:hypothetical protein n=1 Tax=Bacillus cereus TaxID=1396 RepID=UPI002D768116|nr:hypothetical protein [Bacillus cereus]